MFIPTVRPPLVRVVSIDGNAVPLQPSGSFEIPDVSIENAGPATVEIAARNIPLATVVNLNVYSENGADQILTSTPLVGTLVNSAATVSVTFPPGFSRGFVRATWTP